MKSLITDNYQQTQAFAEQFAKTLQHGMVLTLYGDLGFGKTTFLQGFARGLGIKNRIISPTFIIMRTYELPKPQGAVKYFYHVDLYRINHEQEIIDLGLPEVMKDSQNIVAIEWPEKLGKLLPEKRVDIKFEYLGEEKREITIDYD